jgi:uncharacterized protein (DUF2267 family)
MHATGVSAVDHTVETSLEWVDEVCSELRDPDRAHGWVALRAVLQTVRDMVGADEAAKLAAQLPLLLRGLYYEGFDPHQVVEPTHDRRVFLEWIQSQIGTPSVDAEDAVRAVLAVMGRRISGGGIHAKERLPEHLKQLWP